MTASNATFVLVHSGWHNRSTWVKVVPLLEAQAFAALALDLPGAGVHAIAPRSLGARLFDLKALASERSPSAGITQEERTQAVMALVRQAAAGDDANVILVGHSAGGTTVSAVAEQVPELLLAVAYISDFMAPSGLSLLDMLMHESLSSALTRGLFVGDSAAIGATRIHILARATRPTGHCSGRRSMPASRSQSSRSRYLSFIATNRSPVLWLHRKLHPGVSERCRAATPAARRITPFPCLDRIT